MRIIFICGIWYRGWLYGPLWDGLERLVRALCAPRRIQFFRVCQFYNPWQWKAMQAFADDILAVHDTGDDIILVGHSMGGVIAARIAPRFRRSRVRGLVTICSPHKFLRSVFSRVLRVDGASLRHIRTTCIAARFDWMVPIGQLLPGARHVRVASDHVYALAFVRRVQRTVAHEIAALVNHAD